MATYYWVSDGTTKTGNWDDINHWSLTSNGPGGAGIPTATDNVIFDANSGASTDVCYTNFGDACKNFTANASGTAIHFNISQLDIWGNVVVGASVVFDNTFGNIYHYVDSGSTNTINYGGKTVYTSLYFNYGNYAGTTGTFSITGAITCPDDINILGATWTNTSLAINTPRFNISCNDVGPTVVNLGSATYTLTNIPETLGIGSTLPFWNFDSSIAPTYGAPTLNAGTSVIAMGSATVVTQINDVVTFSGGNRTYNRLNLLGGQSIINGSNTFAILSYTTPSNILTLGVFNEAFLILTANQTVTSQYLVSGNAAIQRLTVSSDIIGTARTITIPATRTSNFVDYRDITISGTALAGTSLGNLLGCTNITFTAAVTRYARNVGANFSSTNSWATTSGGAAGASVPLPQDTIIFDSNSAPINADMIYLGGALTVSAGYSSAGIYVSTTTAPSGYQSIFGLITISSLNFTYFFYGIEPISLCNRTSRNFELTNTYGNVWIVAPGATITLTSDLTAYSSAYGYYYITIRAGTLNTNGRTVDAQSIQTIDNDGLTNTSGGALNLSNSNIYLRSPNAGVTARYFNFQTSSLLFSFNAGTSTIHCLNSFTQGAYTARNTFVESPYSWTFYNVVFGALNPTYFQGVRISSTTSQTNQTFNSIGIDPDYPCAVMISMNGRNSGTCITTFTIDSSSADKGKPLIFANDEVPVGGLSFGYYQGQINITNPSVLTLNYTSFKNVYITSSETVIANGVANLGNVAGNKLILASPVAIAAFTTPGNYSITMPANFTGSVAVMAVGGGGEGTVATTGRGANGGGGAATSFSSNFNVNSGQTLYLNVSVGGVVGKSWLNTVINTAPTNVISGIEANNASTTSGGAYTDYAMISLRGGNGGTGGTSTGGGGGGGGGAANSFTTQYGPTAIKGGNSLAGVTSYRGGAGGGGVTGAGVNNTSDNGSNGGTGIGTLGGTAGGPGAGNGGAGSGGSGGGGGGFTSLAGVSGGSGGSGSSVAGDIIAWFTNGVTGFTSAGTGGGGGGGGANTSTSAVAGTFGGNGGIGGIGSGGGGGGGCPVAGRNGTSGSGGSGLVILMYSTSIPVTYATILGED